MFTNTQFFILFFKCFYYLKISRYGIIHSLQNFKLQKSPNSKNSNDWLMSAKTDEKLSQCNSYCNISGRQGVNSVGPKNKTNKTILTNKFAVIQIILLEARQTFITYANVLNVGGCSILTRTRSCCWTFTIPTCVLTIFTHIVSCKFRESEELWPK